MEEITAPTTETAQEENG